MFSLFYVVLLLISFVIYWSFHQILIMNSREKRHHGNTCRKQLKGTKFWHFPRVYLPLRSVLAWIDLSAPLIVFPHYIFSCERINNTGRAYDHYWSLTILILNSDGIWGIFRIFLSCHLLPKTSFLDRRNVFYYISC